MAHKKRKAKASSSIIKKVNFGDLEVREAPSELALTMLETTLETVVVVSLSALSALTIQPPSPSAPTEVASMGLLDSNPSSKEGQGGLIHQDWKTA